MINYSRIKNGTVHTFPVALMFPAGYMICIKTRSVIRIGLSFARFVNPVRIRVLICTDALRRNAGTVNIFIIVRWE